MTVQRSKSVFTFLGTVRYTCEKKVSQIKHFLKAVQNSMVPFESYHYFAVIQLVKTTGNVTYLTIKRGSLKFDFFTFSN